MDFLISKRVARISLLALTLAFAGPAPESLAQNNNRNDNGRANEERRADRTETVRVADQDDTDWGWLGLLGLLGLAGLLPKKRSIEVKGVRDANETRPAA